MDWMKAIKKSHPDFRYFIDTDLGIPGRLEDRQVPDLSAVVYNGSFTLRQVLMIVLNSVKLTDPRENPSGPLVCPTFIVTSDYVLISTPAGCRGYREMLKANAELARSSDTAEKTPKERELEAVLDKETKGFNLPEGCTLADWMKTIKDAYPDFRYFIDTDAGICPRLTDVQVPDLYGVTFNGPDFKGSFTIRHILAAVLESVKVTDSRNSAPNKLLSPMFIVRDNGVFISSPGGCQEYSDALIVNAALALPSGKAPRTPKELKLEAVLDLNTKGSTFQRARHWQTG